MKKLLSTFIGIIAVILFTSIIQTETQAADVENITINSPINLSYKSKQEIYNIRKSYVEKSIFAKPDYEPSEEVFGGIVDNKPWISMDWSFAYDYNNPENYVIETNGPSSHSRSLINPSLPVFIDYPFAIPRVPEYVSEYSIMPLLMVPVKAVYYKPQKEVDITYKKLITPKGEGGYQINAINARDMGYNYIFVDKNKSTYNIKYISNDNLSTSIKELTDFIHLGGSCKVSGGCNNWSITREDLQFRPVEEVNNTKSEQNNNQAVKQNNYTLQSHSLSINGSSSSSYTQNSAAPTSSGPCIFIKLWKEKQ